VSLVFNLVYLVLLLFLLCLIVRLVFDWVQFFARDWRPKGVLLVLAEAESEVDAGFFAHTAG